MMNNTDRYRHLNVYLKEKFGERTLKICVDGGFTCPNRDGSLSFGGCIFCSEKGSGDHICSELDISKQVQSHLESYRGQRASKFIVYFQNFSNTYDIIDNLKKKYDAALIDDRIVGLSIATRPDCVNKEVLELLKTYQNKYYVSLELGLQTSNENTAKLLNLQYTKKQFTSAVNLCNQYNFDVIAHIMIGLPGETIEDIKNTVDFINQHDIQGIKIHSCYVVKNTILANMYNSKEYSPISLDEYLESASYVITHISPTIIVHRISGDAPKDLLIAPSWNAHKKWIMNGLDKLLKEKDLYQGMFYSSNNKKET